MAAQVAGAFRPTPVTMPVPVIAMGKPLMGLSTYKSWKLEWLNWFFYIPLIPIFSLKGEGAFADFS